jgi:predicted phage terminase large subunit-like protein
VTDDLDDLRRLRKGLQVGAAASPSGIIPGAETPSLLATTATEGRLQRTELWRLFDTLALALLRDLIDNLILCVPPQSGKSEYWSRFFPSWWIRNHPDHRVVLASYAHGFASKWGRRCRDLISRNPALFGLRIREDVQARNEWEVAGYEGGMVTAGVEGGIAGRAAEVVIGDDLVADVQAASSAVERAKLWDWIEEELFARCQKNAKRVIVMTRRAVDDPVGRLIELADSGREQWTVISLPAIAEEDENWPQWGWTREAGAALVPELHPLEELERTRLARGPHVWAGLYQQRPTPRGGGDFKSEWFKAVDPDPGFSSAVRSWDLAGSESPRAARTAGCYMTMRSESGVRKFHISDVRVGRWNPGRRDEIILETARADGKGVQVLIEQEPGSGGLAQVQALISKLSGWSVKAVPASGSKELRADPLAAQASVGNVTIRSAAWNRDFLDEVDSFPDGATIDMVDAAAHAFNFLAAEPEAECYNPEDLIGPPRNSPWGPAPSQGSIFAGRDGLLDSMIRDFHPGMYE